MPLRKRDDEDQQSRMRLPEDVLDISQNITTPTHSGTLGSLLVRDNTNWSQRCPDTGRRGDDTSRCNSRPAGSCRADRSETTTEEE